jgi:peptidoglycan-associated lipoprotein
MKSSAARLLTPFLALALIAGGLGCARKSKTVPPAPAPTPPVQTTTTQESTPPTPQTSTPAPETRLTSSDFQPAFFDLDSYTLRDDARTALDTDARLLRDNPSVHVTIEGHCDERGTAEYNQALGERRAHAAKDYLVSNGIDAGRLQTVSYGKERPFDNGHDESAWAKNRRAQITVR